MAQRSKALLRSVAASLQTGVRSQAVPLPAVFPPTHGFGWVKRAGDKKRILAGRVSEDA